MRRWPWGCLAWRPGSAISPWLRSP
jgi:hypothetical protein